MVRSVSGRAKIAHYTVGRRKKMINWNILFAALVGALCVSMGILAANIRRGSK